MKIFENYFCTDKIQNSLEFKVNNTFKNEGEISKKRLIKFY
jgi:hypothetical protein